MLGHFGMALDDMLPTLIFQNDFVALNVGDPHDCHVLGQTVSLWLRVSSELAVTGVTDRMLYWV